MLSTDDDENIVYSMHTVLYRDQYKIVDISSTIKFA